MELTVVQPIKVRMPHGSQDFTPGEVIYLPDKVALRLMELAPGKVSVAENSGKVAPGVWVELFSPLFGMCSAQVQAVLVDECIITDHSVLKGEGEPVTIPASWIYGVYREQQAAS